MLFEIHLNHHFIKISAASTAGTERSYKSPAITTASTCSSFAIAKICSKASLCSANKSKPCNFLPICQSAVCKISFSPPKSPSYYYNKFLVFLRKSDRRIRFLTNFFLTQEKDREHHLLMRLPASNIPIL